MCQIVWAQRQQAPTRGLCTLVNSPIAAAAGQVALDPQPGTDAAPAHLCLRLLLRRQLDGHGPRLRQRQRHGSRRRQRLRWHWRRRLLQLLRWRHGAIDHCQRVCCNLFAALHRHAAFQL